MNKYCKLLGHKWEILNTFWDEDEGGCFSECQCERDGCFANGTFSTSEVDPKPGIKDFIAEFWEKFLYSVGWVFYYLSLIYILFVIPAKLIAEIWDIIF